jgi:beta-lactamase class C
MRFITRALLVTFTTVLPASAGAQIDENLRQLIDREIRTILPSNRVGGVAVAVRMNGNTAFLNYGIADVSQNRLVTSDSLFNLASIGKVFDTTLLALAIKHGDIKLDDPVVKYVPELNQGGDVRRFTIGQLATHTSGLLLPQDHPPWPEERYTLPDFLRTLNAWQVDREHRPGEQHMYTHAGFILLHIALERRFGAPLSELLDKRIVKPLGMTSTVLPQHGVHNPRGELDPAMKSRAVQGYDDSGEPIGEPGDVQGYYLWPGAGQMYSSARDMAVFLEANMGELQNQRPLQDAINYAHHPLFPISEHNAQGLAWEINTNDTPIIEKNGGLDNSSTYIGMVPAAKLGVVILTNRGDQGVAETGRRILLQLAAQKHHAAAEPTGGDDVRHQ